MTTYSHYGTVPNRPHSCDYCRAETAWAHPINMKAICDALGTPYPRPPVLMTVLSAASSVVTVAWSLWFMARMGSVGVELKLFFGLSVTFALAAISLLFTVDAWWRWHKKTDSRYLFQEVAISYANGYRKCFEAWDAEIDVCPEMPADRVRSHETT